MRGRTGEISVLAGDGEEGLEHFAVEQTLGVLGGLVRHEAVDESVCSRLYSYSGEDAVEEVRVVAYGLLEACCAEGGEKIEIVAVGSLSKVVQCLELLDLHKVVVSTRTTRSVNLRWQTALEEW